MFKKNSNRAFLLGGISNVELIGQIKAAAGRRAPIAAAAYWRPKPLELLRDPVARQGVRGR